MKQIIDGKLYDTDKAEKIITWKEALAYTITVYKSGKGNYFANITSPFSDEWKAITEEEFKKNLAVMDTNKYIELFGEVEEG